MNKNMSGNLTKLTNYYGQKTVLVTGASSGIGRSLATLLATLGAHVLIGGRNQQELGNSLKLLENNRVSPEQKFESFNFDLRDSKSISRQIENITGSHRVDILINNAGVYYTNYFQNQTVEEIENMVLTNLTAPLLLIHALIPHFLKNGSGQVINVSSLAAKLNFTGYGVYGATKAGLSHSSKGLGFEFASRNIYFSDFFAPDSLTRGYADELKTMPAETKKINGTVKPMNPDDVAYSLLKGAIAEKFEILPDVKSKAIGFLAKHLPQSWIQGILRLLSK
jgi:short-subunit dehydrogenase